MKKPETQPFSLRLTREEMALLRVQADAEGISLGEYIRRRSLERVVETPKQAPCSCTPQVVERPTRQWLYAGQYMYWPYPLPINRVRIHFGKCPRHDELLGVTLEAA
jgi:hypothetical protein